MYHSQFSTQLPRMQDPSTISGYCLTHNFYACVIFRQVHSSSYRIQYDWPPSFPIISQAAKHIDMGQINLYDSLCLNRKQTEWFY